MIKLKIVLVAALIAIASTVKAAVVEFSASTSINNSAAFVADPANAGKWYGSNYSTESGSARLNESAGFLSNLFTGSGTNSLVYSVDLNNVAPGSYNWSIDTRYSSILQYNLGQVYLLKSGQSIALDGYFSKPSGSTIVSAALPGLFAANGKWQTFGDSFKLTAKQLDTYDVLAFVFTGSKTNSQSLEYDNFSSNLVQSVSVPEPATIGFLCAGALLTLLRRHKN